MLAEFAWMKGTPWKIKMDPTNHPFRKGNYLPNLHDYVPCSSSGVYSWSQPVYEFVNMRSINWNCSLQKSNGIFSVDILPKSYLHFNNTHTHDTHMMFFNNYKIPEAFSCDVHYIQHSQVVTVVSPHFHSKCPDVLHQTTPNLCNATLVSPKLTAEALKKR